MPPSRYTLIHRDATLTDEEQAILSRALNQMAGEDSSGKGRGDGTGSGDGD
jgi:hypothetical protein